MKYKLGLIFLLCLFAGQLAGWAQTAGNEVVVQGTITDSNNGEALMAVNVTETDNTNRILSAAITDVNGHYVIRMKNAKNKLVFSYIGYVSETHGAPANRVLNVKMAEDSRMLQGVEIKADKKINDGSFSIAQRELSTAIQRIDTKEFEGLQVTSLDEALQGRIAGLDIVANSGDLGSGTSMRIRGTTSINASSEPLIVLNGVPYEVEVDKTFDFATANQEQYANMLSINPDDIQDITVLKDAASTAIWGSKGANGVLMITTKKGVQGPTRLQYTYRMTRAVQPEGIQMLNGADYTMMMKQAYFNPNQRETYALMLPELNYDRTFSEYQNFNNNTDWVDEVKQTGFTHDHYLTLSGGGERAKYRVSGGFYDQTGTIIGQHIGRITSRAYLDYAVSDRLKFITEFSFTYSDNDRNYTDLLSIAYRKMPNVGVYAQDLEGNNTDTYYNILSSSYLHDDQKKLKNPVALADMAVNNLMTYRILPTFRIQYDLLDPRNQTLRYNMYVSFDVNNSKTSKYLPREVSNLTYNDASINRAESGETEGVTVQTDNNITWQPKFVNPDHDFMAYASLQVRTGNSSSQGIATYGLPSGEIIDASADGYLESNSSSHSSWRSMGLLGRINYVYKSRYVLGLTFRRDGSTKFGDGRKFGNFPGASVKWIISDESFMKWSENWLSMLAVRPSWGISGNQPGSEYLHFSRYGVYKSYMGMQATRPTSLQLTDLKWETTTSVNYGLDLGLFHDKYVLDLNFYNKRTKDLLFSNLEMPASSGYSGLSWQNVGTMDNNGWEFNFQANQVVKTKNFGLDLNFNLSNYVNTIIQLRDDVLDNYNGAYDFKNGTYMSRIQEGNSYGSIYGFKYKGVYQYDKYVPNDQESAPVARNKEGNVVVDESGNPVPMYFAYGTTSAYKFRGGDAMYEDINHDGNINELDIVYLGNSNPKMNGGFGSTLRYKNFRCSAFFNFRYGNKIVNAARMDNENMYTNDNQSLAVNYRWRKDGDETHIPRALYNYGYNWLGSDRFVEDGSFLRFKYLTFNYAVPLAKLKKYKLNQLSFYLTFNNLAVWTKYSGVDPEVGYGSMSVSKDESKTPRSKDFTLGVTIGL